MIASSIWKTKKRKEIKTISAFSFFSFNLGSLLDSWLSLILPFISSTWLPVSFIYIHVKDPSMEGKIATQNPSPPLFLLQQNVKNPKISKIKARSQRWAHAKRAGSIFRGIWQNKSSKKQNKTHKKHAKEKTQMQPPNGAGHT